MQFVQQQLSIMLGDRRLDRERDERQRVRDEQLEIDSLVWFLSFYSTNGHPLFPVVQQKRLGATTRTTQTLTTNVVLKILRTIMIQVAAHPVLILTVLIPAKDWVMSSQIPNWQTILISIIGTQMTNIRFTRNSVRTSRKPDFMIWTRTYATATQNSSRFTHNTFMHARHSSKLGLRADIFQS